ncbi:hypothetical protein TNCV_1673951 [Trichonephila clavipes]|nr:hypothetical protein TNCV_1673951 [Trichonephila clavipes]
MIKQGGKEIQERKNKNARGTRFFHIFSRTIPDDKGRREGCHSRVPRLLLNEGCAALEARPQPFTSFSSNNGGGNKKAKVPFLGILLTCGRMGLCWPLAKGRKSLSSPKKTDVGDTKRKEGKIKGRKEKDGLGVDLNGQLALAQKRINKDCFFCLYEMVCIRFLLMVSYQTKH